MTIDQILFDNAFWQEARRVMHARARPIFRDAFLIGAALGAHEKPRAGTKAVSALSSLIGASVALGERARGDYPGVQGFMPVPGPDGRTMLPFDFEAIRTASEATIEAYLDTWWSQLERSTRDSLRRTIQRAAAEGWTIEQVMADVEPLFGPARAQRIAVSESTNLLGRGAQATYEAAGFDSWEWRSVRDAVVDATCAELDGRTFSKSVPFQRAHVNCRCWPVPAGEPVARTLIGGPFFAGV